MGRKEKTPIIIFSVFNKQQSAEHNRDVHETVKFSLATKNIGYKELLGHYKGDSELSILVRAEHENLVKDLCKQFKQECYLVSGPERDTSLVYPDGTDQKLGTLQRVSEHEAKSSISFTYDFSDNSFWLAK